MNFDEDNSLEDVIKECKRCGITKAEFKAQVLGQASTKDIKRGKTNATRHQKGKDLNDMIDLIWDDLHPARDVVLKAKKEWRATWVRLAIQTICVIAFIIGLSILLNMME